MFCCKKNTCCIGLLLAGIMTFILFIFVRRQKKQETFDREYINKDIYDNEEYAKNQVLEEKFEEDSSLKEKINEFNSKRLSNDKNIE